MTRAVLGIDTSNYATSLSVVDEMRVPVWQTKLMLPVKSGEVGLRQSDAVFAHIKNLPTGFSTAADVLKQYEIVGVGVSERPRNHDGSYMPCFLAGVSAAVAIASTLGVPLFRWSHQCGHLMAAIYGADAFSILHSEFGAFHVSGGTTELVRASLAEDGFQTEVVGGSLDLHAGQVIDRIGVRMGESFPAGPALEQLALSYAGKVPHRKPATEGCYMHLSGLENLAERMYTATGDSAQTAAFVFDYIASSLEAIGDAFRAQYGNLPLLYAGGVMSSKLLQARLSRRNESYFAPPVLSADNAVGVGILTALRCFPAQTI